MEIFRKLVKKLFFLILVVWAAKSAIASDKGQKIPGYDEAKLSEIKAQFESYFLDGRIPNYAFGLYSAEGLLYSATNGNTSLEGGSPVDLDTIYWMASMTKPVVSAAIMKLVAEKKIELDDELRKYFPEFSDMLVAPEGNYDNALEEAKTPITLRHLISHTSGLTYGTGVTGVGDVAEQYDEFGVMSCFVGKSLREQTEMLSQLPLISHPGEAWNYSVGIDVLGAVIEEVSQMTLDEYLKKEFFEPMGMSNSGFYVPRGKRHLASRVYTSLDAASLPEEIETEEITWKIAEVPAWKRAFDSDAPDPKRVQCASGGGGLWASVNDYASFVQMVMNGGTFRGESIMSSEAASELLTEQTSQLVPEAFLRAFGDDVASFMKFTGGFGAKMIDETTVDYHFWGGIANTFFWMDTSNQHVGVFATHLAPSEYNVSDSIEEIVDQAKY